MKNITLAHDNLKAFMLCASQKFCVKIVQVLLRNFMNRSQGDIKVEARAKVQRRKNGK